MHGRLIVCADRGPARVSYGYAGDRSLAALEDHDVTALDAHVAQPDVRAASADPDRGRSGRVHRQAFDGQHVAPGHLVERQHARVVGLAVEQHHADAAQSHAAAVLGAFETEFIAQHPQQGLAGVGPGGDRLAVERE